MSSYLKSAPLVLQGSSKSESEESKLTAPSTFRSGTIKPSIKIAGWEPLRIDLMSKMMRSH